MVAGLIGGNGHNSTGVPMDYTIRGIAPNVNLINLRVLDQNGSSTDSTVISGIQQAIALKAQYNIRIINLSLGRPVFESYTVDPLCQAVQRAWQAGIAVVVAAGNNARVNTYGNQGYGTINAPANSPYVITVGAMNTMGTPTPADDKMASYSSKGPTLIDHVVKPDIVAPGNQMVSIQAPGSALVATYPNNRVKLGLYMGGPGDTSGPSNQYFELSGTWLAAPMVSGAAALLIQQNPAMTPDQVKARLMQTATKLPQIITTATDPSTGITYLDENDIFTVGAGYLNVPAALTDTSLATLPATSPTVSYNSATQAVSLITPANVVWGSNVIWGTGAIWGNNLVWGRNVVWGNNVIWGSGAIWGNGAIWGETTADQTTAITIAINGDAF